MGERLDRWTSWAARVIAIGGFLVAAGGWATGCATEWLHDIVDDRLASQHATEILLTKEMQRDVLRRVAGNRYVMIEKCSGIHPNGEPFVALNEAFLAFADEPAVMEALKTLWDGSNRDAEHVVALIKRMATAANMPVNVDDVFLDQPFAPTAPSEC